MNYDFYRIDYTICGITYPGTLKILPPSGNRPEQKFAIGDKNGVLQCLNVKDEDVIVQFKTLPGKSITSVQLVSNNGSLGDKIFTASGNEVKGYTKKGKVFLSIETSLTETITSMYVLGSDLILCSGRTVTFYKDLVEINSYNCEDRVLDLGALIMPNVLFNLGNDASFIYIGSEVVDFILRRARFQQSINNDTNKGAAVLEDGHLLSRVTISSGPSRLAIPTFVSNVSGSFYGASDGSIGFISYKQSKLTSKCLVDGHSLGSVVCMGWFNNDTSTHLAVGRHDGSVQLYLVNVDNIEDKPRLKYTYFCGEPVTSIDGGRIGTEEMEILVATFSGRIFALRPGHLSGAAALSKLSQEALTARRVKLESEVARLDKQASNERDKYQRNTKSVTPNLSAPPLLDIHCELTGATGDGWQEARLTSAVPLDMLFIYSKKKFSMLTDTAAVLSVCSSQENLRDLLATVRCQAGTRRLWIRMRSPSDNSTPRSESAVVHIYALPAGAPRVARLITIRLPAMPYYSQHEDMDCEKQTRPWCELRISGSFSVAEFTSWLTEIFPGDLPRPAATVNFARIHTLLGTLLICRYQRGLAVFTSDNVSTITELRHIISNCSVEKSIRTEISHDVPENSCVKSFELLEPLFKLEYKKKCDIDLRNALSSLDLDMKSIINNQEEDSMLCNDYIHVIENIKEGATTHFEQLVETVVQWHKDWNTLSLKGDCRRDNDGLMKALKNCELKEIKNILTYKSVSPIPNEF